MADKNKTKVIAEKGKQELFLIREFNAPRELVFKAFTTPELYSQWMLPKEHNMRIDFMDYRSGGAYRFIVPGTKGEESAIFGVVHEVTAPERLIRTFEFAGLPEKGHLALEKTHFECVNGGKTKVTVHFICESVDYRDGLVNSGMEAHSGACHDVLDSLLKTKINP